MMLKELLLVGTGGFFGSIARYLVSLALRGCGTGFPWATLTANLAGCLLIGLLYGLSLRQPCLSPGLSLLLTVGFCGGFTTFSTFSRESLLLLQSGSYVSFGLYVSLSVLLGLLLTGIGIWMVKQAL